MLNQTTRKLVGAFLSAAAFVMPMATLLTMPTPVVGMTIPEFDALPVKKEVAFIEKFVNKIAGDIDDKDHALAEQIRDYFFTVSSVTGHKEGIRQFSAEETAIKIAKINGRGDPSTVAVEDILVNVIENGLNVAVDFDDKTRKFSVTRNPTNPVATSKPATTQSATTQP